jgi:predicted transglutaminase-like cysteine proteinase
VKPPGNSGTVWEDYVLLKRRMLIQAGWPRETLLVTVVRNQTDEGHAILTVITDEGGYILDNQLKDISIWSGRLPLHQASIAVQP